jgi:prepilin-type N-terminal cleavage/methylation domain-containing protein
MKMIQSKKCNQAGFTLIELLVVISIIAILMAIMMPALGKAREQAKKTVCITRNRQWAIATISYAAANDDNFPWRYNTSTKDASWGWPYEYCRQSSGSTYVFDLIENFFGPYITDNKAMICPDVRHSKDEIIHLPWDRQKIESVKTWGVERIFGDYSFFLSYNAPLLDKIYGNQGNGYLSWGAQKLAVEPTNDTFEGKEPPCKLSMSKPETPASGDRIRYTPADNSWVDIVHPYSQRSSVITPSGMCASFVDGSSRWVPFEDMRPMFQLSGGASGQGAFWPNPTNNPNYGYRN